MRRGGCDCGPGHCSRVLRGGAFQMSASKGREDPFCKGIGQRRFRHATTATATAIGQPGGPVGRETSASGLPGMLARRYEPRVMIEKGHCASRLCWPVKSNRDSDRWRVSDPSCSCPTYSTPLGAHTCTPPCQVQVRPPFSPAYSTSHACKSDVACMTAVLLGASLRATCDGTIISSLRVRPRHTYIHTSDRRRIHPI